MDILAVLVTPFTEAGKWLISRLKHQISFLTKYNRNLEKLLTQARDLQTKRSDIFQMVEEARGRLEEPYEEVAEWLRKTDRIQEVVATLNLEARVNKRCFKGLCPDLGSHLHLSKHAVKTLDEVRSLQEKGSFTKISRKRRPLGVEAVQVDWVEGFPSRVAIMNDVMEALCDESITSIGVYGMGGSGKTTLMRSLNNKLLVNNLFDKVIMVTVSQDPNLKEIQDNIGSRLGLDFGCQDSELTRASKLLDRLKMEEKVLLILDDLWKQLDVAKVGLPCDMQHKGCKIIITTRDFEICTRMKVGIGVEMKLLSEIESWNLFEAKAGNVVTLPSLKPVAEEIVRRCKGSPLAIVVLGSSLCEVQSIGRWRRALNVLKNPYPGGIQGVMQEVATPLRYSYEHLHGPEIKLCFLFCCLFPEDYDIDLYDLRNYGIAEGFLNANGGSLEDASDELLDYIEKLRNSGLLLNGDKEGYVKMHDVVRDVAIWIASEDSNGFRVNMGGALGNWSDVEKLKAYKRISFMKFENGLNLSVPSECEPLQLRSLLIRENKTVTIDHESFFDNMNEVVIFDMRGMYPRPSVPESITHLTNLKALFLVRCDISSSICLLGGIINLEILCCRESRIGVLPKEIGNLTKLKCLDLTGAEFSVVAPNVISRLSNLEELLAWTNWPVYEDWDSELASLVHLSRLEVQLRSEKFNAHSLPWKSLKQFSLGIDYSLNERTIRYKRSLYLGWMNPVTHWVSNTMMTQRLFLDRCNGFNNILDLYEKGGFEHLEYLDLHDLPELKSICEGTFPNGSLEKLQYLTVRQCYSLEYILSASVEKALRNLRETSVSENGGAEKLVESRRHKEEEATTTSMSSRRQMSIASSPSIFSSFQNLQKLSINRCPRLKKIFSFSLASSLQQLMYISVQFCDGLECIIGKGEEKEATAMDYYQVHLLPQLQNLILWQLPCLTSIYQQNLPLHSSNLKGIQVHGCPNLKMIPLGSECLSTKIYADIEKDERVEGVGEGLQQHQHPIGTSFVVLLI